MGAAQRINLTQDTGMGKGGGPAGGASLSGMLADAGFIASSSFSLLASHARANTKKLVGEGRESRDSARVRGAVSHASSIARLKEYDNLEYCDALRCKETKRA